MASFRASLGLWTIFTCLKILMSCVILDVFRRLMYSERNVTLIWLKIYHGLKMLFKSEKNLRTNFKSVLALWFSTAWSSLVKTKTNSCFAIYLRWKTAVCYCLSMEASNSQKSMCHGPKRHVKISRHCLWELSKQVSRYLFPALSSIT